MYSGPVQREPARWHAGLISLASASIVAGAGTVARRSSLTRENGSLITGAGTVNPLWRLNVARYARGHAERGSCGIGPLAFRDVGTAVDPDRRSKVHGLTVKARLTTAKKLRSRPVTQFTLWPPPTRRLPIRGCFRGGGLPQSGVVLGTARRPVLARGDDNYRRGSMAEGNKPRAHPLCRATVLMK